MQKYDVRTVDNAITSGFVNFYIWVRYNVTKNWKSMTRTEKMAAARALVLMGQVAKNPKDFLSRAKTEDAWRYSGENFANAQKIDKRTSYLIVQSPVDILWNNVAGAFKNSPDLYMGYYRFCKMVLNWEYDRTSTNNTFRDYAYKYEQGIIDESKRIKINADIAQTTAFMRPIKALVKKFSR